MSDTGRNRMIHHPKPAIPVLSPRVGWTLTDSAVGSSNSVFVSPKDINKAGDVIVTESSVATFQVSHGGARKAYASRQLGLSETRQGAEITQVQLVARDVNEGCHRDAQDGCNARKGIDAGSRLPGLPFRYSGGAHTYLSSKFPSRRKALRLPDFNQPFWPETPEDSPAHTRYPHIRNHSAAPFCLLSQCTVMEK